MSRSKRALGRKSRLRITVNGRNEMDGLVLLTHLRDSYSKLVFFDPQYRHNLDHMKYGNEGEGREKARAALPQMSDTIIRDFICQIDRVLAPSGHLFLWVDKFIIAEGKQKAMVAAGPSLKIVDLICWNKMRPGMGRRARCRSEYLVVAQKIPTRAKDIWLDHSIDDCWPEQSDRSEHPHAKPHQLTERLIRCVTSRGDIVVDPCAGSYGVLDACVLSGRKFVGCDLI